MEGNDFWIPRNLDAPPLFFMWEADDASLWILCLLFGGLMDMFVLGLVCAVIFSRSYSKIKEEGGTGLMAKIMYWYTPSEIWLSKEFPSHVRGYIGG